MKGGLCDRRAKITDHCNELQVCASFFIYPAASKGGIPSCKLGTTKGRGIPKGSQNLI